MKSTKSESANFIQINRYLTSAQHRVANARKVIRIDEQTGFQMAYDAMLRASLALLLSVGMRPRSTLGHHKVIIEEVDKVIGKPSYRAIMSYFDMMRRKRNEALYEPLSTITEKEAHEAIDTAQTFLTMIRREIQLKNPQQKLL